MANQYSIHQMRHYVAHLLRSQPDLLGLLSPSDRPPAFQDLEDWSAQLPHRDLARICLHLVKEAVQDLEYILPLAFDILRAMVPLPGEWDLDDALALTVSPTHVDKPVFRDEVILALEELLHRGLLVSGREALRFVVPFPVRFCLKEREVFKPEDPANLRERMVSYFARRAVEEEKTDSTFRGSWRLTNLLYGFKTAVDWLEELQGETITRLAGEGHAEALPVPLARSLAEFGQSLGATVARRRSDQGWRWLMGAVVGAQALQMHRLEADLFRYLGHYFRQTEQLADALECLDRARRRYLRLPDPQQACLMSSALALTRRDQGDTKEALKEFEHAWMLACEYGLDGEKVSVANCAGSLCLQQGDSERARVWFLRGWKLAEEGSVQGDFAELCTNIGRSLRVEGRFDEALHWFSESLKRGRKDLNRPAQAAAYAEIARLWEEKGDPGSAVAWLEQALSLRRDLSDGPGQAAVLRDLARCARLNHRFADAQDYALRARALARRHGLAEIDGEVFLEIAELAVARSDDPAATEGFVGALDRLGSVAPAPFLARIHFRLALILYRRGVVEESARHMLSAQALARHAQAPELLDEIDPWLGILADQLDSDRFDILVERVTELWETGGLGGRNPESPRGRAPR